MSRKKKAERQFQQSSSASGSRVYSRENAARYSERSRQRRRRSRIKKGVVGVVVGVLVGAVVAVGAWAASIMNSLNDETVIDDSLRQVLVDADVAEDPFYILLLGVDGRDEDEADRSDTIILARVDPDEQLVTLISIPRDTKIEYEGETMKINAVHAYAGAAGMVEAVNELCGVEISHYAEIDFEGMVELVDAVGGIWITVPEGDEVDDPDAGDVVIEAGYQHMDGEAVLTFCRARHQYSDGDYTRMRHQRMVIAALADQILNNLSVTDIVPLVNSISDMVITDLSASDIISLINAMRGMDTDAIWSCNIPSWAGEDTYIDGISYVFVYEDELEEMMERVDAGEDPEGSQTSGSSSESATTGDLEENSSEDWINGTATTSSDDESDDETDEDTE